MLAKCIKLLGCRDIGPIEAAGLGVPRGEQPVGDVAQPAERIDRAGGPAADGAGV